MAVRDTVVLSTIRNRHAVGVKLLLWTDSRRLTRTDPAGRLERARLAGQVNITQLAGSAAGSRALTQISICQSDMQSCY